MLHRIGREIALLATHLNGIASFYGGFRWGTSAMRFDGFQSSSGAVHAGQRPSCAGTAKVGAVIVLAAFTVAACVANPPAPTFTSSDLSCANDTPQCLTARRRALSALMADKDRRWAANQPTAKQYAAGVRLFAFTKQKAAMSCPELKRAEAEAKRAGRVLRADKSAGLTPAQISRAAILGDEVARTLKRERRKRCR